MTTVGRTSETFPANADLRRVEYRREVFLRFYDFHLRYRAHPEAVYQHLPHLRRSRGWNDAESIWYAFLLSNTGHPVTALLLFDTASTIKDAERLGPFLAENYNRLPFDVDRRYQKNNLLRAIGSYQDVIGDASPYDFWSDVASQGWAATQRTARTIYSFGRLGAWEFAENLRLCDVDVVCDDLLLADKDGSHSHRSGLCLVAGLDEHDWIRRDRNSRPEYPPELLERLEQQADELLAEAYRRASPSYQRDVNLFTLESALCTYKLWHRPNRRYPNVYTDIAYDRIRLMERLWPERSFDVFWQARAEVLPQRLRLEDSPYDPGYCSAKQNHYRLTGQVVMMDGDYPDMRNDFNDAVENRLYGRRPT